MHPYLTLYCCGRIQVECPVCRLKKEAEWIVYRVHVSLDILRDVRHVTDSNVCDVTKQDCALNNTVRLVPNVQHSCISVEDIVA